MSSLFANDMKSDTKRNRPHIAFGFQRFYNAWLNLIMVSHWLVNGPKWPDMWSPSNVFLPQMSQRSVSLAVKTSNQEIYRSLMESTLSDIQSDIQSDKSILITNIFQPTTFNLPVNDSKWFWTIKKPASPSYVLSMMYLAYNSFSILDRLYGFQWNANLTSSGFQGNEDLLQI